MEMKDFYRDPYFLTLMNASLQEDFSRAMNLLNQNKAESDRKEKEYQGTIKDLERDKAILQESNKKLAPDYNPYTPNQNEINGLRNKIQNLQEEIKNLNNCLENDASVINALNVEVCNVKMAKKTAERENTDLKNRIEGEVARYERLIREDIEALTQKNKKITVLENTLTIEKCNREFYKDCFTVSGNKNKILCDEMQTLRGEKSELEAALEDVSVAKEAVEAELKTAREKAKNHKAMSFYPNPEDVFEINLTHIGTASLVGECKTVVTSKGRLVNTSILDSCKANHGRVYTLNIACSDIGIKMITSR